MSRLAMMLTMLLVVTLTPSAAPISRELDEGWTRADAVIRGVVVQKDVLVPLTGFPVLFHVNVLEVYKGDPQWTTLRVQNDIETGFSVDGITATLGLRVDEQYVLFLTRVTGRDAFRAIPGRYGAFPVGADLRAGELFERIDELRFLADLKRKRADASKP